MLVNRLKNMVKMSRSKVILVLALVLCYTLCHVAGYDGEGKEEEEESWKPSGDPFMMQKKKQVVKTEAGEMRIVKGGGGFRGGFTDKPLHIGLIMMEPKSLFVPQYLDSDLILFIRRGEARLGHIYKDDLVELRLKIGDVYRIPGGSPFYLVNTGEGQRLHVICGIDRSDTLGWGSTQPFYIGGGTHPASVLAGFDTQTLATAFNVSTSEVSELLSRQQEGPIVFLPNSHSPSMWTEFLQKERHERKHHLKKMVPFQQEEDNEDNADEEDLIWSFRKMLRSVFGTEENKKKWIGKSGPDSYNIYDRKPDYKNDYGWSIALDRKEYSPLGKSDIGVYLVNLTGGSMMAPHINPTATEYGIVLRGSGTIQVVYPNGTLAMNARVTEGDVFYIPRFFPFCQIASRSGPFEFFGFTTSAHKNRPQFLVGANSVLQTLRGPEVAEGFGVSEERLREIVEAQKESVILPSAEAAPPDRVREKFDGIIRSLGDEIVMGFE